ncbi:MAG: DUF4330 domain-containing protein [Symbiobacteriaceae bacterium]|nr:MAG: hypothetical protein DIU69_11210 [Bacillota bacterium]
MNAKRRFPFNLIDIAVVLGIVVLAVVLAMKLGPASARPQETREITFSVLVSRVPEVQARNMFSVGDTLYSPSGHPSAEIVDVQIKPSPIVLEDGGYYREGESRYFYEVLVTARGQAVKVQNHYEIRGQSLQIGRPFSLATPRAVVNGTVVDVKLD